MLKSLLASALFAGLIAGLFGGALQLLLVVPLIHEAELYETGALTRFGAAAEAHAHDAGAEAHSHDPGEDAHSHDAAEDAHSHDAGEDAHAHGATADGGAGRALLTLLTMILSFCGFALVLVAAFALAERAGLTRVAARRGALWGLAGFAAVQLMPAMGLPPELPGSEAAALEARQLWWLMTVVATGAGLALLAFGSLALGAAGVVLILLPHLVGAPMPDAHGGAAPPELAGLFAARALGVGALTWLLLGGLAGHFWARERPA